MSIDRSQAQDEVVVLPPVPLDPVFVEAVDDALAGPQEPTSDVDPERVLGADPHDFAGLYIRHRSSFALHARRFLRDPRDVDEVVQEAFLRLFLALPELDSELQALSYCRRTITNLCIDRYRADQRRPRLIDLDSAPTDALGEAEQDDPVVQAEDAALVREALALLSPLHREALVKREIEEKPLPVIAEELGVPEDSVKHLLHRARRALRRRLVQTHLTSETDPDDVSTLTLLARSAASGGAKASVVVVLLAGVLVSTTSHVPAQALSAVSALLGVPVDLGAPNGRPHGSARPAVPGGEAGSGPQTPGSSTNPLAPLLPTRAAVVPPAVDSGSAAVAPAPAAAAATTTVATSPSPSSSSTRILSGSRPSPRPSGSSVPLLPRSSASPSPRPSQEPSTQPTAADDQHLEVQPEPTPSTSDPAVEASPRTFTPLR